MTNRRTPAQRPTKSTTWKPTRARSELIKAIGGAAAVVLVTALLIFIMKPGDTSSGTTVPATSVTSPTTTPTASTPTASTPAAPTPAQP